MKYQVTRFKSLPVALKEIEPLVRDPRHLHTGKPFERFGGMRPREMLANWLLCATFQQIEGRELMFYSDPVGGDGIIRDEATGETWQTEHVYVSQHSKGPEAKSLILDCDQPQAGERCGLLQGQDPGRVSRHARGGHLVPDRSREGHARPAYVRCRMGRRLLHG